MTARKHGTRSCYQGGCRCDECRAAQAAYTRVWAATHPQSRYATRHDACPECGEEKHVEAKRCRDCETARVEASRLPCGTRAAYERGCRCDACVDAYRAYYRALHRRLREERKAGVRS